MIPAVLWWVPPCGVLSLLEKLPNLFELGEDMWRKVSPQFWWTSMILMLICLNVANTLWSLWLTLPKTFGASRKHIRIWLSDMPLELLMYVTMWYGRLVVRVLLRLKDCKVHKQWAVLYDSHWPQKNSAEAMKVQQSINSIWRTLDRRLLDCECELLPSCITYQDFPSLPKISVSASRHTVPGALLTSM